ncbi:hypothetical protein D9757_011131 [Collybiopsis confluens]|uniref:Uncharacterized protein n=1 Tax=Collybiopsis confluens TaxID=2823264 RepID=A0A8H5H7L7_9AGAR|nr:hypothetical protein D9757_011131 [Collybiopsis confluens]
MANPELRSKPTPKILVNQSNLVGTTVQQSTNENDCHNAYESLNEFFTVHETIFTAAASGLASLQYEDSSVVETSVSTFTEYCPIIIQGLDWLGQLHPFIEMTQVLQIRPNLIFVATKAFSVVITKNLTRINNNKKVMALQIQIQSTMMVLFELRRLKKLDQNLEGTMEKTMRKLANDIKEAGICLRSLHEEKLSFGAKFAQHREDLALALNVQAALGVDIVDQKLDGLTKQNESLQMTMIEIFKKLDTPREIEAKRYIEDLGGPKQCLKDEGLGAFHVRRTGDDDKDFETARKKLLQDFSEDLDQAFNRNLSFFERKMDMQCKQMQNIIEESLHNEGLLILSVLKAGIHDRIIDPDMKCLWKENEWKGSVKARHFVLALQDFYIERQYTSPTNSPVQPLRAISNVSIDLSLDSIVKDDRWPLKYINCSRYSKPLMVMVRASSA